MRMMEIDGVVSDIPSSLLCCLYKDGDAVVQAIAPEYIQIRFPEKLQTISEKLILVYLDFKNNTYNRLPVDKFICEKEMREKYYWSYILKIEQQDFTDMYHFVVKQYYEYTMLKLESEGIDQDFSKALVGYPSELDETFSKSYKEWMDRNGRKEYICQLTEKIVKDANKSFDKKELALSLENYIHYQAYLTDGLNKYFPDTIVKNNTRYYIGNQFCHNLFPKEDTLFQIMEKVYRENKGLTLAFTYLREEHIDSMAELFENIYCWCEQKDFAIEIVINDYGFLRLLAGKDKYFNVCLGILLNKRRKDPRHKFKIGFENINKKQLLSQNQLNQKLYYDFLKEHGVERFEHESCGYDIAMPEGNNSLHLPFYQTNTSQYCTLYALCKYGDRSKQQLVKDCPGFCEEYACAYPDHLNFIGRYNSLFGLDTRMMEESLQMFKDVDRYVWNAESCIGGIRKLYL